MNYYNNEVVKDAAGRKNYELKNYNNEFLLVYATDLISSVSSDKTLTSHIVTRAISGIRGLSQLVSTPYAMN